MRAPRNPAASSCWGCRGSTTTGVRDVRMAWHGPGIPHSAKTSSLGTVASRRRQAQTGTGSSSHLRPVESPCRDAPSFPRHRPRARRVDIAHLARAPASWRRRPTSRGSGGATTRSARMPCSRVWRARSTTPSPTRCARTPGADDPRSSGSRETTCGSTRRWPCTVPAPRCRVVPSDSPERPGARDPLVRAGAGGARGLSA